jgi:hypothetical protein
MPKMETAICGDKTVLKNFHTFLRGVEKKGLEYWFPENPIEHWKTANWLLGFESFLRNDVVYKGPELWPQ